MHLYIVTIVYLVKCIDFLSLNQILSLYILFICFMLIYGALHPLLPLMAFDIT